MNHTNGTTSGNATASWQNDDASAALILFFSLCLLMVVALAILLFGGIRRKSICYVSWGYLGICCYARCCCKRSEKRKRVVTEKVKELHEILSEIEGE